MITKLLLQEKAADINLKLDGLKDEIETHLASLTVFIEKVRAKVNSYDLDVTDQGKIAKINDRFEIYYNNLRHARDGLFLVGATFRRIQSSGV
ncbi:MAG: hypothetical protein EOT05_02105 [Candidatus Microsaccharimonas sossegonensis]|uniref:Uncharacterized protein n=1 Tax=Candidatus Microsaccharimonas sossegonensis TaxID=2506948 RepID=A0A4Q0AHE3_9BACT|nr:MAG: hypothetical protein EOT05_02105 [Candidatus Microsaccharimonas sossegonensis]